MIPFSPQNIIDQTNKYRVEQGLSPLNANPQLMKAAQDRANDMAVTGNFSHNIATTTPGMQKPWGFIQKNNYPYTAAGENLATLFNDATSTLQGWKNSPTHNKNLIDKRYQDMGVAVVPGTYQGQKTYFVVQMFGAQASLPKIFPIAQVPQNSVKSEAPSFSTLLKKSKPVESTDYRIAKSTPMFSKSYNK